MACSEYWEEAYKIVLTSCPRFTTDDGAADNKWIRFLNIIRNREPTQDELDLYLGEMQRVSYEEAIRMCSDQIGVLCTHRRHVREFNHAALLRQFQDNPTAIVPLTIGTSAARVENLRPWLTKEGFHELTHVAVGARVILTANINMDKGELEHCS